MIIFWAILVGYLLGSISFSYLIAKKVAGIDIRQHGSGNAGATNTLRVIGKGPAILVLLLDAFKGVAAVLIFAGLSAGDPEPTALAGLGAILGHNWPVFFGFKGGKGVATTIGVLGTISFFPTLYSVLVAIILIVLTRYVSLGSLILLALIPVFMYFRHDPSSYIILGVIVAILGIYRHRENVKRLLNKTERKLGSKKS